MADDFENSIKSEFLLEADELLEEMETSFLRLEQTPGERGIMDHIFRLVHTIKGSSYSAGFEQLGGFAHLFESLLNILREGRMQADPLIVDLLLRSNDQLKRFCAALKSNYDATMDTSAISEELTLAMGDDAPKKWTGPAFGFFDDDDAVPPTLVESDSSSMAEVSLDEEISPESPKRIETKSIYSNLRLRSIQEPIVMVCDDDPEMVETVVEAIRELVPEIFEIVTANDGQDALDKIKIRRPHLLITDLRMPNMSGMELIKRLRAMSVNIPVMVLSGFADRGDMIEFIKLGVTEYLDKPIRPLYFAIQVRRSLHLAQIREAIDRLSILNFRVHMNSVKMLQVHENSESSITGQKQKIDDMLDEIASLINFAVTL